MQDIVIHAENLGKVYRIGENWSYDTLRDVIASFFSVSARKIYKRANENKGVSNLIWALKNVSFKVRCGEIIGIIGRNGAGKSTLLKILSRITTPTEGYAKVVGRVGSLLEIGTGFHSELTGRDNIYLSGAILGMRKREIDSKFDEIVSFAELDKFIYTPVKHYSSGMYMRLAFAVAAHLESEILLVDEVLAVGDAAFQNKCLGKMGEVAKKGKTVLFVSHNIAVISSFCTAGIWIDSGTIRFQGTATNAIDRYLNSLTHILATKISDRADRLGSGWIRVMDMKAYGNDSPHTTVCTGKDLTIDIDYSSTRATQIANIKFSVSIRTIIGQPVTLLCSDYSKDTFMVIPLNGKIRCRIPRLQLSPGAYLLNVCVLSGNEIIDFVQEAMQMCVMEGDFYGTGRIPGKDYGPFLIEQLWSVV